MRVISVTATPLYAPRWLPYSDGEGAFGGSEGRRGEPGRRRSLAGQESRHGLVLITTDSEHTGVGEIATCWTPDGVDQCRCVTEKLAPLVEGTADPTNSINRLVAAMDGAAGMDFGPAKAGVFMYLIPVCSSGLAIAFLGEALHLYHLAGIVLIVSGIWLVTRKRRVAKPT